ncbi:MAG: 50S ribosomal protein L23 [Candidatus Staskawiczbacteria bacterium]|nr:50S ribosomal protein L23 [Candidatus Staskawiczbacteria bacterium]
MAALFDFLKRKKDIEKAKKPEKSRKTSVGKKPAAEKTKKAEKKTEEVKITPQATARSKKTSAFSFEAVREPHISEKATYLSEKNQYIFKVSPNFNKNEIKNAVQGIYGVDVLSVNLIKVPEKKRRLGKTQGFRKGFKKAIVKIKEGQKIEIL